MDWFLMHKHYFNKSVWKKGCTRTYLQVTATMKIGTPSAHYSASSSKWEMFFFILHATLEGKGLNGSGCKKYRMWPTGQEKVYIVNNKCHFVSNDCRFSKGISAEIGYVSWWKSTLDLQESEGYVFYSPQI